MKTNNLSLLFADIPSRDQIHLEAWIDEKFHLGDIFIENGEIYIQLNVNHNTDHFILNYAELIDSMTKMKDFIALLPQLP